MTAQAKPSLEGSEWDRAVEACAEAIRRTEQGFLSPEYAAGQPLSSFSERFACVACERAVLALKRDSAVPTNEGEQK
jgi:hypothetical protein